MNYDYFRKGKSVKSFNQCQPVKQTIYDIAKAHGGELKVEMVEGEGSEFIIELPIVRTTDLMDYTDYTD